MKTPVSARKARKNKKGDAASSLTPVPLVPSIDLDVKVMGVRLASSIPVILVNSGEVPKTAETT